MHRFVRPLRRPVRWIVGGWAALMLVVSVTLMAGHWAPLPEPESDNRALRATLDALRRSDGHGRWVVLHVLYGKCKCSGRVLEHLFARRPLPNVAETLLLVGANPELEQQAKDRGFSVLVARADELNARFGIASAPLFVVADGAGSVRYAGGYTGRKQSADIRDVAIIRGLERGEREARLPILGCAVSRSLQKLLDPLGVKYGNSNE